MSPVDVMLSFLDVLALFRRGGGSVCDVMPGWSHTFATPLGR